MLSVRSRTGCGKLLYALASRVLMGPAERYAVLSAASAADRLTALLEAVELVAAVVEFSAVGVTLVRALFPEIIHGCGVHVVVGERGQSADHRGPQGVFNSAHQAVMVVVGVGDEVAGL